MASIFYNTGVAIMAGFPAHLAPKPAFKAGDRVTFGAGTTKYVVSHVSVGVTTGSFPRVIFDYVFIPADLDDQTPFPTQLVDDETIDNVTASVRILGGVACLTHIGIQLVLVETDPDSGEKWIRGVPAKYMASVSHIADGKPVWVLVDSTIPAGAQVSLPDPAPVKPFKWIYVNRPVEEVIDQPVDCVVCGTRLKPATATYEPFGRIEKLPTLEVLEELAQFEKSNSYPPLTDQIYRSRGYRPERVYEHVVTDLPDQKSKTTIRFWTGKSVAYRLGADGGWFHYDETSQDPPLCSASCGPKFIRMAYAGKAIRRAVTDRDPSGPTRIRRLGAKEASDAKS